MSSIEPTGRVVDLNADVGEGFGPWSLGDDAALMDVITSANVACGFHAGDPTILRRTCALATGRGIAIGAQVSYPDLVGFGRRRMAIAREDLSNDVIYQIGALDAMARVEGSRVTYVKPHGALNNACDTDEEQAAAVADAVLDPTLRLYVIPGTQLEQQAHQRGLVTVAEAYPDRGYLASGRLVPRSHGGALVDEPDLVVSRAVELVVNDTVSAVDGRQVELRPGSICLHGDNVASVRAARRIRRALETAGVTVAA
ncbi:MAG: LamB/YcsF family protein [Pseudonocardiaceae bacterium]